MVILITLCSFIAVGCIIYWLLDTFFKDKIEIQHRIKKYITTNEKHSSLIEGSFYDRFIAPTLKKINNNTSRIMPKNYSNQLEKSLRDAGIPTSINASTVISMQIVAIFFEIIFTVSIGNAFKAPAYKMLLVIAAFIGFTYIFPGLYLKQKMQKRYKEIEKSLPDVLDLMTVSIEAGLSFDGAMAKLVEKMKGELVNEFAIVLKEMRMGVSKRDALKAMVERVPVENLISFVSAILQADELGVPIGNVLRVQSNITRQKRRQKASELAMQAPVKMLVPMIFFFLPTIFIVLLGPAFINITKVIGK